MINSFQQITAILAYLGKKKTDTGIAFKYKLVKHLNHATSIYIFDESGRLTLDLSQIKMEPNDPESIAVNDETIFPPVDIRYISSEDYQEDKAYYDEFFDEDSSFEGVTRRLSNAFGQYPPVKHPELSPIVSFYSYKGGVGRSTALAALASYHARRTGAKVLILDCDFEAPGLVNFFGMNEEDLAAKGGIIEYLTDTSYLPEENTVDISQYIHTISAGASGDPLGYAGEKGTIYVMNAGNVSMKNIDGSIAMPRDLRTHQDHYLHGLARLDFGNSDYIVGRFQRMLRYASEKYSPDVILIDSRTGFNDILNNIALRLSDIVIGFFGTSRQNTPGLYNFLDTIVAENQFKNNILEVVLINSIAPNVRESYTNFKKQIETYNSDTENELNPEAWSIEYTARMAEIGTPTDKGDTLLDYTSPLRYSFPDYQNGKGERLLEYLSTAIEKKNVNNNVFTPENEQPTLPFPLNKAQITIQRADLLNPLKDFFSSQNISYAENLQQDRKTFLEKFYYFRNYLRDLFLKEIFIVRGYKGTGKTLLYHALEEPAFVKKLKEFYDISENFRFINIIDELNVIELSALNFNPDNIKEKERTYYRRFWIVYIWNTLVNKLTDIYSSPIPHFDVTNEEITRTIFEDLIKDNKILEVEFDLRKINEALKANNIKVIISFDYLDKIIKPDEWGNNNSPISQLIDLGQLKQYSNLYPKIFVRTDLYSKVQNINNANALENKILSLDWTTEELFAYFFKVVYNLTSTEFIQWLRLRNPDKGEYISSIESLFIENDAQIPLEEKEKLEFLVNNFFGEYVNENIPNFGKSYSWFHQNLKNANDVISIRPFIALLDYSLRDASKNSKEDRLDLPILPGTFFTKPGAREYAAKAHLTDILKERNDEFLTKFVETMHISNDPKLEPFRKHSIAEEDLCHLILNIFELNGIPRPRWEEWQKVVSLLEDAAIIRQNTSFKVSYSFAFLYKYYLRLKGNPRT